MNGLKLLSRLPGVRSWLAKSLGWQNAMFGDVTGGRGLYEADLAKPYARSAWVRSAIQFVAAPISMRPLVFTADRRGGDVVIEDAALTAFWQAPGRCAGGRLRMSDFLEATVGWLKLKGQCFWIMDDSWDVRGANKSPLILARPDEMTAIYDGRDLLGWSWLSAKGNRATLIPSQVIHLKFWNPYHDVLGLAEWEAAMIAAESDYAAGTFARNLAKNNGDRGPFVIGKGGQFSDDQIKQVSAALRQKRELGRTGEFRAAFIPADVEVKDPTVNAVDAAYVGQRLENRKEIYIAFGVPPSFADPQASYSIGSASDRFRLIEDTCMPLAAKIADGIEEVSARFMGNGMTLFAEFEWDSHSTMQQVRAERFETAVKAVDRGMPWKVAGDYFRLKLPGFAGDSVGRIPFNLTEISDDGEADAPETIEDDNDPVSELETLFAAKARAGRLVIAKDIPAAPNAEQHAKWLRIHKAREPWEKKFASKVSRYLMDARAETLRNMAAAESKAVNKSVLDVLALIFDLDRFLGEWIKGLLAISRNALEAAGMEVWSSELERDDPMTQPAIEIQHALSQRENKLKGAGEKVWQAVKDDLQAGIDQGETMQQLAERVRRKFSSIDKTRAMVIARTETTVVYETARDMAFRAAGVQWKQWLCSGLGNERLTHYQANEQIVAVGEKFEVGGFPMAYPGDPEGPAKEVINCNCVAIAAGGPNPTEIEGNDGADIPY